MNKFLGYRCSICNEDFPFTSDIYTCPKDNGNLDVILDAGTIRRKYEVSDITSRRERITLEIFTFVTGQRSRGGRHTSKIYWFYTTVFSRRLKNTLGLRDFWIKDEGRNPTGSFKTGQVRLLYPERRKLMRK